MVRIKSTLIAALSLLAFFAATAQTPAQFPGNTSDMNPQLKSALQELGYEYQIYDDGSVLVMVPTENGGKVPVAITTPQKADNGATFRIIMVPVRTYEGDGPANLEASVHKVSQGLSLGILKTVKHNGKTLVVYGSPLPVSPSADTLGTFLRGAVKSAAQAGSNLNIA